MKKLFIMLCLLINFHFANSQSWESIGEFGAAPSKVWYDSISDRLYVAGGYCWFDSSEIHGFGYISGDTLIGLGCGFGIDCGVSGIPYYGVTPVIKAFANYKGDMYVAGHFDKAGENPAYGIAKWGGTDWVAVGSGLTFKGVPAHCNRMEVMNGELYVYGNYDSINGIAANGLCKFNGTNWSPVFDLPNFYSGSTSPNIIHDSEWFQGELYVGGNFYLAGSDPPIRDIVKWNGTEWVAVGNGITGGFNSITNLTVYKNKLIIAGHFNREQNPGSIPGNNITAWDGMEWDTLRGGLWGDPYVATQVWDIQFHNGEMYAIGWFNYAGGVSANHIAKWDGNVWCGTRDIFSLLSD